MGDYIYFFKHNGNGLRCHDGQDENRGIDLRTDGGIVVLAPSPHESGNHYHWVNIKPIEHGLDDLLEMPAEVSPKNVINVELLQMVVKQALGLEPEPVIDGEVIDIKQITRNDVDEAK